MSEILICEIFTSYNTQLLYPKKSTLKKYEPLHDKTNKMDTRAGLVAWSDAHLTGIQTVTHCDPLVRQHSFRRLVMQSFLQPFSPFQIQVVSYWPKDVQYVLDNRLGLSRATEILKSKSVRSTDDVIGTCVRQSQTVTKTNDSSFSSKSVSEIDYFSNTL